MSSIPSPISARIRRLLEQGDLAGLVSALRNPGQPEQRAQAAWALGELRQMEAVESLARSVLEDPEASVQAAARRALQSLLGSDASLALASYRKAAPEDPWLQEPPAAEQWASETLEIGADDLSGLILIARHEPDLRLRLKAVRMLAHSRDTRATDTLAELVIWGDTPQLRDAARQALESVYGEQAGSIVDSYRDAESPAEDDELSEDAETSPGPLGPEVKEAGAEDLDEELDEDDWDDDADDELAEDEEDELAEIYPRDQKAPLPSPFASNMDKDPTRPVVEDMGLPWQTLAWILLILVVLAAIFFFLRP